MASKLDANLEELHSAATTTRTIASQIRSDGQQALQAMDIVEGGFLGVGGLALMGFRTALVGAMKIVENNLEDIGEALDKSAEAYGETDGLSAENIAAHNVSNASLEDQLRGDADVTQAANSTGDAGGPDRESEGADDSDSSEVDLDDYTVGPPRKPDDLPDFSESADDFFYDPDAVATEEDEANLKEWKRKAWLADNVGFVRGLDQAADLYNHYLNGEGETYEIDLAPAYSDDGMRASMDKGMDDMMTAAQQHYEATGDTEFSLSGPWYAHEEYPTSEEWQKTLGGHVQWTSGDFVVVDGQIQADLTVHAEDRYNFNKGENDVATGAPDDINGRFVELGEAHSFRTEGSADFHTELSPGDKPGETIYRPGHA